MRLGKWILKIIEKMINLILSICIIVTAAFSVYALWDNNRIYAAAENVQKDMIQLKPAMEEDEAPSFEELRKVNPDVCAWVTLDGTKIDFPVLQGETNLTYINRDVYGEFSLGGSIYLDTRNKSNFNDAYSMLYGHHMENSGMFGDLDLYKEQTFFDENSTGMLILPEQSYQLRILACMVTEAGNEKIFDPEYAGTHMEELFALVKSDSLHISQSLYAQVIQEKTVQILAFSTCSSEFTDARTIILAVMEPNQTAG